MIAARGVWSRQNLFTLFRELSTMSIGELALLATALIGVTVTLGAVLFFLYDTVMTLRDGEA